jgi:hypothetical protein
MMSSIDTQTELLTMTPQDVTSCWQAVFPNSASSTTFVFNTLGFRGYLANSVLECPNRIMDNDPLMYTGRISDGSWVEYHTFMYVKPTDANRVYSSASLRKKTIKNITREKLTKRFQEVRKFVMDNAHNLKDPMFDISTK